MRCELSKVKKFLLIILNLFSPVTCSLCGCSLYPWSKVRICCKCRESLPLIKSPVCQKCGNFLPKGGKFCHECKKHFKCYSFDRMRSVYWYKGSIRELILKFKYSNRIFLSKDFALAMYETMKSYDFYKNSEIIIPVPLNIVRKIKRGYNQAELLALELSLRSNIPVINNVLFRRKVTKPQFKLSKIEREKNIKNSFFVKNNEVIKNKSILLIDDVATTLSTVSACSLTLKNFGAKKVYVLTLARD